MKHDATYWIEHLNLTPHPEGGFYSEVYRSSEVIPATALPARFGADRVFSTSIFYLLQEGDFSSLHRIKSDETWHFYGGDPLEVVVLTNASAEIVVLGQAPHRGERLQFTVQAGAWFGARPAPGSSFSLVGCTVSPGFDFADFEMGTREGLTRDFPACREVIESLTRT